MSPHKLSVSLKETRQANHFQIPQRGPFGEKYPLTGHMYVSLNISLFIFPSESPVKEPFPYSLTGSPWTGTPRHQGHWSIHSFFHSFIHSFMYVCLSPQLGALLHMGKNISSLSMESHADEGLHTVVCGLVPQRNC
jgi:hypothetical protein